MTNRRIRLKPTCHCEERSDVAIRHPLRRTKTYCYLEKKRIPTTSDIGHWFRNDSGFLYSALSFPKWHFLHPGDPSVACATAPLVGAPRARRIDMPPLPQIPHFFQSPIDIVAPIACQSEEGAGCGCGCDCDARPFWKGLEEQINSYVDGHTLAQCMRVNEKTPAVSAARNEDKVVQYE